MDLDEIRQEINLVDNQMKELFLKRMELAYQVAENNALKKLYMSQNGKRKFWLRV